ncbi:hypothetical protein O0Q50_19225 [Priestia aryabhattai]|uniref:Uncharacterized protein n=1 Tax=Priestia aryabhattai TaxID=412384 RepID=A0AAX6NC49_PRIAR|nr:hypothetical protein [Priestia aryabhattai]MDU9693306.1 hypothetical protein [Priestia aryabhattai]
MNNNFKYRITKVLDKIKKDGIIWKKERLKNKHLRRRREKQHLNSDASMEDYEKVILELINEKNNDVFLYYKYEDDYFIFGNRKTNWIAIFSEEAIIDTAFIIDEVEYDEYLSLKDKYLPLGKLSDFIE